MNIKSQIAAARALAPRDMIRTVRALQAIAPSKPMADLCDALERACELLAMCDGWISADPEDASHFVELAQVRAFLAGEVKP